MKSYRLIIRSPVTFRKSPPQFYRENDEENFIYRSDSFNPISPNV